MKLMIISDVQPPDDPNGDFTGGTNYFIRKLFEDKVIDYPINDICFGYLATEQLKTPQMKQLAKTLANNVDVPIITLGAGVNQYFIKEKLGAAIDKEFEFEGRKIYPCYSPGSLKYNPGYAQIIAERVHSVLSQVYGGNVVEIEKKTTPYELITTYSRLHEVLDLAVGSGIFCFDFETTGLEWWKHKPTLLGFSIQPGYSYIVPLYHQENTIWQTGASYDEDLIDQQVKYIFELLRINIFENDSVVKIAHNLSFELGYLAKYGVEKHLGEWHDTMLMSHELDENRPKGLKKLTELFFPSFAGYDFNLPKDSDWSSHPLVELSTYCAIDTDITCRLFMLFTDKLLKEDEDYRLYRHYRSYVIPALFSTFWTSFNGSFIDLYTLDKHIKKAEDNIKNLNDDFYNHPDVVGFLVQRNKEARDQLINELNEKIDNQKKKVKPSKHWLHKWEKEIIDIINGDTEITSEFSLNSPQQVQKWIYEYLKLPEREDFHGNFEKTARQDYVLELANTFNKPVLKIFCELKVTMKILSTYLSSFKELCDSKGYIHANFHVSGTDTGRLSSSNPNLQNIPTRNPIKDSEYLAWAIKAPKDCFIAPTDEDWVFLQADYSQAELRLIANFSEDEKMIKSYLDGIDLHTITGAAIVGMDLESFIELKDKNPEFFKENRQKGKTANFGIVYGISETGYQEYYRNATGGLILPIDEARKHKQAIFGTYEKLPLWHSTYELKAVKYKYVRTLYGRKRRLPHIDSVSSSDRGSAKRASINSPIQGSAGEWTVFAMSVISKIIPKDIVRISNNVHDAVYPYIKRDWLSVVLPMVNSILVDPLAENYLDMDKDRIKVPMKVDWAYTENSWANMKESDLEEIINKFTN